MTQRDSDSIDRLVKEYRQGGADPTHELIAIVYDEMRHWARARLAARRIRSMGSESLVNEALIGVLKGKPDWKNKRHIYGVFVRAINNRLADYVRRRRAPIHGGDQTRVSLDPNFRDVDLPIDLIIALRSCLERLQAISPGAEEIVRLRFYGGMTFEEIADRTGLSISKTRREWVYAKSFLFAELSRDE